MPRKPKREAAPTDVEKLAAELRSLRRNRGLSATGVAECPALLAAVRRLHALADTTDDRELAGLAYQEVIALVDALEGESRLAASAMYGLKPYSEATLTERQRRLASEVHKSPETVAD